jgi:hypothetical protein
MLVRFTGASGNCAANRASSEDLNVLSGVVALNEIERIALPVGEAGSTDWGRAVPHTTTCRGVVKNQVGALTFDLVTGSHVAFCPR